MNVLHQLLGLEPDQLLQRFDAAVAQGTATAVAQVLAQGLELDYQLSVPQVAEVLGVDDNTVRAYTELPEEHQRRLHYVTTSDSARGKRITVSQIADWQRRNCTDPDSAETLRRKAHAARLR